MRYGATRSNPGGGGAKKKKKKKRNLKKARAIQLDSLGTAATFAPTMGGPMGGILGAINAVTSRF